MRRETLARRKKGPQVSTSPILRDLVGEAKKGQEEGSRRKLETGFMVASGQEMRKDRERERKDVNGKREREKIFF